MHEAYPDAQLALNINLINPCGYDELMNSVLPVIITACSPRPYAGLTKNAYAKKTAELQSSAARHEHAGAEIGLPVFRIIYPSAFPPVLFRIIAQSVRKRCAVQFSAFE